MCECAAKGKSIGSFFWHWKLSCATGSLFKDILYNVDVLKRIAFIAVLLFFFLANFGQIWKSYGPNKILEYNGIQWLGEGSQVNVWIYMKSSEDVACGNIWTSTLVEDCFYLLLFLMYSSATLSCCMERAPGWCWLRTGVPKDVWCMDRRRILWKQRFSVHRFWCCVGGVGLTGWSGLTWWELEG